jgi:uncharacterized protein (TIGR03067 family)
MKTFACLCFVIAVAAAPSVRAEEPKGDLAKLQGTWTAKVGPNRDLEMKLTVKDGTVELAGTSPNGDDFKLKGEIKIDEKASPKTLDWLKFSTPDGNDIPDILGLYKLEGDNWTVCSGMPGDDRPTEFKAGEGGPPRLTTWVRVKPKTEDKPKPDDAKSDDLAKFQGSWTATLGANKDRVIAMDIKGTNVTVNWPLEDGSDITLKGEIKLNEKANPRRIDFFNFKSPSGNEVGDNFGIYAVEEAGIKICIGGPSLDRPSEFKAGSEEWPALFVLKKK